MRRTFVTACALLLLSGSLAVAHGPKGSKPAGVNGGDIVDVDGGHLELVVQPGELRVYVTDLKDVPAPSADLTARAIIQTGDKQIILPLAAKEPNLLIAPLAAPLVKGSKVAISTTLSKGGKAVQARFVVK